MISGKRRIPLVYSNQKAKDPIFYRYIPQQLRLVKFGYSIPVSVPILNEVFYRYFVGESGRAKYATIIYKDPISIKISVTDINGVDQTQFLQQMSTATTITLRSVTTSSNYMNLTIKSFTSTPFYWTYEYILGLNNGLLNDNEQIKITYS